MEAVRSIRESLGGLLIEQDIMKPDEYKEALNAHHKCKNRPLVHLPRAQVEEIHGRRGILELDWIYIIAYTLMTLNSNHLCRNLIS